MPRAGETLGGKNFPHIETLSDFSKEVQRIVDERGSASDKAPSSKSFQIEAEFDALCKRYPDLADEYLQAMARDYEEWAAS